MQLTINNLLPIYFPDTRKQTSEVWGKELSFQPGEMVKIVAPSGSGKTSLMHFLYGLRSDYHGEISYGEKRSIRTFNAEDFAAQRKEKVSIVLQDMRLLPEQTVYENLFIKHQLQPFHPVERIKEMTERLGIGSKLNSKCKTCSYGEQQRVAIIRALLQPFQFLLLDEPFSHLDNNNSMRAMDLMLEEAKVRGAAIVFADLERIDYFPFTKLYHL
ncbi:ATP-binding cassette domain-containing protein [Flavisolibacter ginsenosidimutans]|uniref:ATP-binding cassette domain-containing protein n=1 Tax=Flavisolibacter ginsenosidimutans TaxID=661481 RepID=A0A5B8UJ38_9BACT|nr:ATP-binding cassette domain-containing protein [Flavisolibacter ginsenosidimutans]QEC56553.1 ATP-binding cassette domain-containing protein [Flavisolibacter ginsenosidimutans]